MVSYLKILKMPYLDISTVVIILILISVSSTIMLIRLWNKFRRKYKGTIFWVSDLALQTVALTLIALRGLIPDWLSIVVANSLTVTGIILGLIGLEAFFDRRSRQIHNFILVGLFAFIHAWYTFKNPVLGIRNLNLTLVSLLVFLQCVWLLYFRVPVRLRPIGQGVRAVMTGYSFLCLVRIGKYILSGFPVNDFFAQDTFEAAILISHIILMIFLAYTLILMFSRRLLEEVRAGEEKFSSAFRTAPYLLSLTRIADGLILDVNEGFETITGHKRKDVMGLKTLDIDIWADLKDREMVLREAKDKGVVSEREIWFKYKNGSTFPGLFSARVININDEACLLASITDITQRKALEKERFRLFDIIDQSLNEIYLFNSDSLKFEYANQGALSNLGYSFDDALSLMVTDIKPEYTEEKFRKMVSVLISGEKEILNFETYHKRKDGSTYPVEIRLQLFKWDKKSLFFAVVADISERMEREAKIRMMNEELEIRVRERTEMLLASNKELEAFSYSISHDLRAPLRAIEGFSRILADDFSESLGNEGQRLIAIIRDNTRRMGNLIDDLLTFSKLGRSQINMSGTNMRVLVESVFKEITTLEENKTINLHLTEIDSAVCDYIMVRQVWANLISNAVKFSSLRESIDISIKSEKSDNMVVYSVTDNGIGFDMKYYRKLFGVFERLHNQRDFEGTGVGLAIVKRIVNRHGGSVWAESERGKGATFFFTLPGLVSSPSENIKDSGKTA